MATLGIVASTSGNASGEPAPSAVAAGSAASSADPSPSIPASNAPASNAPVSPASGAPTVVSLTFDDASSDQLAAAAALRANGLVGTFYVPSGSVGQPGALSVDDLTTIYAGGNEIGGETVNRRDLTQVTADEAQRQICDARNQLSAWGFPQTSFANPYGASDAAIGSLISQCGYNSARLLGGAVNANPPASPYALAAIGPIDATWTLDRLQAAVTGAEQSGGWAILTFRHICDAGCDPESNQTVSPQLFGQFAQWLAQHIAATPSTTVHTVSSVVGGTIAPAVSAPAPATPGGALANGSLEDSRIQNVPTCWSAYGYGDNSPIYGPSGNAKDGDVAETITMNDYENGDAKILPTFDTGSCTPAATAGHKYQLSAWYRSNVKTQFVVYYRTATGGFAYLTSSPYFPASSGYRHATWTTPALPDGATGISFGLNIFANGALTTDLYSMTDAT